MKETKKECAVRLLKENHCMINSCLSKEELKNFNGDFVQYLINVLKQNNKDNIYHNGSKSKWIKLKSDSKELYEKLQEIK